MIHGLYKNIAGPLSMLFGGYRELAQLKQIIESFHNPLVSINNNGEIRWMNKSFIDFFGYSLKEAKGKCLDDLIAQGVSGASYLTKHTLLGNIVTTEGLRKRSDGLDVYVGIMTTPIKQVTPIFHRETVRGAVVEYFDLSAKYDLLKLIDTMPVGLLRMHDTEIVFGNPESVKILGGRPEDTMFFDLFENPSDAMNGYREYLKEGYSMFDTNIKTFMGTSLISHIKLRRMTDGYTIAIFSDIRKRKETEKKVVEISKLEALQQGFGGAAHELNQIMLGQIGYASLLLLAKEVKEDQKLAEYCNKIIIASQRGGKVTGNLLDILRGKQYTTKTLSTGCQIIDINPEGLTDRKYHDCDHF